MLTLRKLFVLYDC